MSSMLRNLKQIWEQLRSQKPGRLSFLEQLRIQNFRGIADLTLEFPFPVCVLAGANGCGKSTVLFGLACAYRNPTGAALMTPARLFPEFQPASESDLCDAHDRAEFVYSFKTDRQPLTLPTVTLEAEEN